MEGVFLKFDINKHRQTLQKKPKAKHATYR